LHERWDLRFSEIRYLPRPDAALPQRFLYTTRIGFGLRISGEGESVGSHDGFDGERCSSLRFWSEDPKSLISVGSGYWKYVPCGEGGQMTRFITGYDYRVRFGMVGRLFDRVGFRPLIGWATAWSFDRLRLWIEKEIDPAISRRQAIVYTTARLGVAVVWLYEGIVPKLIFRHADELALLHAAGLSRPSAERVCLGMGLIEAAIGLVLLIAWRSVWPLWFTLAAMPVALLAVAAASPGFLTGPFNPIALNVSVFALAAIALQAARELPSASHCIRRAPRSEP